jgi:hypothetical protein
MPRKQRTAGISARVRAWIGKHHDGNTRAAARALNVDHVTLWRAQAGHFTRPPYAVLEALAEHTNIPLADWLGEPARRQP